MAWSSAELSSDEIALAAADKPILASNAAHGKVDPTIATGWDWSLGNDAAQPATRVADGLPGIRSSTTTAGTSHVLTLQFTSVIEFDFFAIIGHNFDTFGTFDLNLRVADDFAFTSNVQEISIQKDINPTDTKRLVDLSLIMASDTVTITRVSTTASVAHTAHNFSNSDTVTISGANQSEYNGNKTISNVSTNAYDYTVAGSPATPATGTITAVGTYARRYSNVKYIEIGMLLIDSTKPTIGQVILGRRRQLKVEPDRPWDPTNLVSSVDDFESRGGVTYRTARHTGRRMISAQLTAWITTHQTDIKSWYTEINYGANPFIWIDKPNSDPTGLYFMHQEEPSLSFPYVEWNTRVFMLIGKEQGPNFVSTE